MNANLFYSIIVILISVIIFGICESITSTLVNKHNENNKKDRKRITIIKLLGNIIKYVLMFIAVIVILSINGIDVKSLLAGLGVVSIIAGLALQDFLKDIIMGFNIIIDNYFNVGDIITINGITGKVIEIGIKVTRLKNIETEEEYIIANRNITEAVYASNFTDIDIPISYNEKIDKVEKVINKIIDEIKEIDNVVNCEYKSINEFGESAIFYKIRVYIRPDLKYQPIRDAKRIIKVNLDKNNIEIPFNQIDVHNIK